MHYLAVCIAHYLIRLERKSQSKIPDASRVVRLDQHVFRLEIPVSNGGLDSRPPTVGDLCVEVGEAGRNTETNLAEFIQADQVELQVVAQGAFVVESGHQPEFHLQVFSSSVNA